MAKILPQYGQGVSPARQAVHISAGFASTADVQLSATAAYDLFNVDDPIAVVALWTRVSTAFTASVALDIGDSGSTERFSGSTTIGATTSGAVWVAATGLTVPYEYASGAVIQLDVNGATVAAGQVEIYLEYIPLID